MDQIYIYCKILCTHIVAYVRLGISLLCFELLERERREAVKASRVLERCSFPVTREYSLHKQQRNRDFGEFILCILEGRNRSAIQIFVPLCLPVHLVSALPNLCNCSLHPRTVTSLA